MRAIYLASQSPRRRELLEQIGVTFDVISVQVDEVRGDETPVDYVHRLSRDKAMAGVALFNDRPVLGADTIVVLGEQVLEKPYSREQGIEMLLTLSGQTHQVMTAVSLCLAERYETRCSISSVTFRVISEAEAAAYWVTGEPADKAGGYGIQGKGGVFVRQIQGSYSGIVGLPVYETEQLLRLFGVVVLV
jgi:septum formation protein